MTRALVSIWKRLTPWRADPGAAWWKLCQASPRDGTANHQTLRLSSDVLKGRRPVMWHTELMEKVTWWSRATRTRLPQKKAQRAACPDQTQSPPHAGGGRIERAPQTGSEREIPEMTRSLQRSGANFC